MNTILDAYGELLREVDSWFSRCLEQYPQYITCTSGCSACCRGLFDITLLDALYLHRGFQTLAADVQEKLQHSAEQRLHSLSLINPNFTAPWLLNGIAEEQWDELMPEDDDTPCLLLSPYGQCMVYQYRPMTCRLNGIPMIDDSGEELFDEWCTLNFTEVNPRGLSGISAPFNDIFYKELLLFRKLLKELTGAARNEVDLFIPAALLLEISAVVKAISTVKD